MHLLGKPDAEIEASLDLTDAIEWMDMPGMYLVGDRRSSRISLRCPRSGYSCGSPSLAIVALLMEFQFPPLYGSQ
jgi:hypothetical protein